MEEWASTCPGCGAGRITTVRLPRPHGPTDEPTTQLALRCLECGTQWADEEHWRERRAQG